MPRFWDSGFGIWDLGFREMSARIQKSKLPIPALSPKIRKSQPEKKTRIPDPGVPKIQKSISRCRPAAGVWSGILGFCLRESENPKPRPRPDFWRICMPQMHMPLPRGPLGGDRDQGFSDLHARMHKFILCLCPGATGGGSGLRILGLSSCSGNRPSCDSDVI